MALMLETRAGDAAAGEVLCRHCSQFLGSWQEQGGRRAFRPNLATVRAVECGDGWTRLRCRRCDNRTTLDHVDAT